MYRIGEFARLSQVPIRTLRYYDQIGLLVPAQVSRSRYRGYSAEQLAELNRILALKDLGLSLGEIRALCRDAASASDLAALLQRKHAELGERIAADRRRLARLAAGLAALQGDRAPLPEIAIRASAPCWIASLRAALRCHDDCEQLHDELARSLPDRRVAQQRGAIWHACAPGEIDCEAFQIIPGPIAVAGRARVRMLPARQVAALVYRDDTDYLPAYRALRSWLADSGLVVAGAKRELFLRGRYAATEIQFPVARGRMRRAT